MNESFFAQNVNSISCDSSNSLGTLKISFWFTFLPWQANKKIVDIKTSKKDNSVKRILFYNGERDYDRLMEMIKFAFETHMITKEQFDYRTENLVSKWNEKDEEERVVMHF